jgi:hypothetical protein
MKDAGLRLRVEKELRAEFVGACRLQGKRAAEVLRDFMRSYVQKESAGLQSSLFKEDPPPSPDRSNGDRRTQR